MKGPDIVFLLSVDTLTANSESNSNTKCFSFNSRGTLYRTLLFDIGPSGDPVAHIAISTGSTYIFNVNSAFISDFPGIYVTKNSDE